MEITKRFHKFLEELSQSNQIYLHRELVTELTKVKNLINELPFLASGQTENAAETTVQSNQIIPEIIENLLNNSKKSLDTLQILHLFLMNTSLNQGNIHQFLRMYFKAIFNTEKLDIICETDAIAGVFNTLNAKPLSANAKELLVKEVQKQFEENTSWTKIEISKTQVLRSFYSGELASKPRKTSLNELETDLQELLCLKLYSIALNTDIYVITDHSTHNVLLEKYFGYAMVEKMPIFVEIVLSSLQYVFGKSTHEERANFLTIFESLELMYLELVRKIFIKSIQQELVEYFEAETIVRINKDDMDLESTESPKIKNNSTLMSKRKISLTISSLSAINIETNFNLDLSLFSHKISNAWKNLNRIYKKCENRTFQYLRRKFENQNKLEVCLGFNASFQLVYQNIPIPEAIKSFLSMGDFINDAEARSHYAIFGKTSELLAQINEAVLTSEKSSKLMQSFEKKIQKIPYEIIITKSKSGTKITHITFLFSIELEQESYHEDEAERFMKELEINYDKSDRVVVDLLKKRTKRPHNLRKTSKKGSGKDEFNIFETEALESLRETIISEYLPERLTGLQNQVSKKAWGGFEKNSVVMKPETVAKVNKSMRRTFTVDPKRAYNRMISYQDTLEQQLKFDPSILQSFDEDANRLAGWSFNIPLIGSTIEKSRLAWVMLDDSKLLREFSVAKGTLCEFINQIKTGYTHRDNPFHNYDHALTVMHSTFYILKNCGFVERFSKLIHFGMLIAAFCHDVDHPGRSNLFEINSKSELAITYHDRSVLEQYHAAYTFRVLKDEACNIFSMVSDEEYKILRKLIINCILSTDMKEHFELIEKLKTFTEKLKELHESPSTLSDSPKMSESPLSNTTAESNLEWSEQETMMVTGCIIHVADLSGPAKDFDLAYYWSTRVIKEFTEQIKEEERLKLPVAPYMLNLNKKPHMAKNEFQFMQFVVKPLWVAFNDFTADAISVGVKNIESNIKRWEEIYQNAMLEEEQKRNRDTHDSGKEDEKNAKSSPVKTLEDSKTQDQPKNFEEAQSEEQCKTEKVN